MSFTGRFTATVHYQVPQAGRTSTGGKAYGPLLSTAARVETRTRLVRNARGQEVISAHTIMSSDPIPQTARVWIPGTNTANLEESKEVISVGAAESLSGRGSVYETYL